MHFPLKPGKLRAEKLEQQAFLPFWHGFHNLHHLLLQADAFLIHEIHEQVSPQIPIASSGDLFEAMTKRSDPTSPLVSAVKVVLDSALEAKLFGTEYDEPESKRARHEVLHQLAMHALYMP